MTIDCHMTESELADLLRVNVRTMRRWRKAGRGPRATRLGLKIIRYQPADIAAWMQSKVIVAHPAASS